MGTRKENVRTGIKVKNLYSGAMHNFGKVDSISKSALKMVCKTDPGKIHKHIS